jgi:hypothetical protein
MMSARAVLAVLGWDLAAVQQMYATCTSLAIADITCRRIVSNLSDGELLRVCIFNLVIGRTAYT